MNKLKLDELKNGLPGVSKNIAAFLVEAAVICLDQNGYRSGLIVVEFSSPKSKIIKV